MFDFIFDSVTSLNLKYLEKCEQIKSNIIIIIKF